MRPLWDPSAWYSTTDQLTHSVAITVNDDTWYCQVDVEVLVAPHGVGTASAHTKTIEARITADKVLRVEMLSHPLADGPSNVLTVTYRPEFTRVGTTTLASYLYTSTQSFALKYDATPPFVTVLGASNGAFTRSLSILAGDAASGLAEWGIDIEDDEGYTFSATMVTPTSLLWLPSYAPEGAALTVTVTARDVAGNSVAEKQSLRYDTTPPLVAFSGYSGEYFTSGVTIDVTDASSGVAGWSLDVRGTAAYTDTPVYTETSVHTNTSYVWTPLALAEGAIVTLTVAAEDLAGNPVTGTHSSIYDPSPPLIEVAGVQSAVSGDRVISHTKGLTVTVSDAVSGIERWALNIYDQTGYTSTAELTVSAVVTWFPEVIAEGTTFTVGVEARDIAGNVITQVHVLLRDTTAPNIDVSGFYGGAFHGPLSIEVSDAFAGVREWQVEIGDASGVFYTSVQTSASTVSWTPVSIDDGAMVTVTVIASDVLGYAATQTLVLIYDASAPVLVVTGYANGSRVDSFTRSLRFDVSDPGRSGISPTVQIRVEARGVPSSLVTVTVPADWSPEGRFRGRIITVTATVYDVFGNTDAWQGRFLYAPQAVVPVVMREYCNLAKPLNYGYDCWEPNDWFSEAQLIQVGAQYIGTVYRDMSVQDPVNGPSATDRRDFFRIELAPWHTYAIVLTLLEDSAGSVGDVDLYLYPSGVFDLERYEARSDKSGGSAEQIVVRCVADWKTYMILATAFDTPKDTPRSYALTVTNTGACEPR